MLVLKGFSFTLEVPDQELIHYVSALDTLLIQYKNAHK